MRTVETGKLKGFGCAIALVCLLSACTEPGETTGVGAATGGVIGAGLGAIVGSQTGNAGSGLAIGAAAGAGTGAMIANALQAQEETLHAQDEAIERQEQLIRAQKSEIDELRRMNQAGDYSRPVRKAQPKIEQNAALGDAPSLRPERLEYSNASNGLREKDLQPPVKQASLPAASRASFNWQGETAGSSGSNDRGTMNGSKTPQCIEAQGEATKANALQEPADKLFHLRRALRLCPDNASYHNSLGELYLTLDRAEDAQFEFDEALRLDPENRQTQANLEYMKNR